MDQVFALPDGKRFVSAGDSGAFAWDIETGTVIHRFVKGDIQVAVVSPDGSRVLTGGRGYAPEYETDGSPSPKSLWLWDTDSGDLLGTLGEGIPVEGLCAIFSPDGGRVAVWGGHFSQNGPVAVVHLYDVIDRQLLWDVKLCPVFPGALAFSPDGAQMLLAGSRGVPTSPPPPGVVTLLDASTGQSLRSFEGHTDFVELAAFSSDGTQILSGGYDRTVRLWDVESGQLVHLFHHPNHIRSLAFSLNGARILTTHLDNQGARLWDASSGELLHVLGADSSVDRAHFTPDSLQVLTSGRLGEQSVAQLWNAETGQVSKTLEGWGFSTIAFLSDGSHVLAASGPGSIWMWNLETTERVSEYRGHSAGFGLVAVSPDEEHVLTAAGGSLFLWESISSRLVRILDTGWEVWSFAFSPDGTRIIAAGCQVDCGSPRSRPGVVKIWATETGEELLEFEEVRGPIRSVAFSRDGNLVLTACGEEDANGGTATIWDAQTGQEIRIFKEPDGPAYCAAFSPDGSVIATGASRYDAQLERMVGAVRIWDSSSGELVQTLGTLSVEALAFSSDGAQLLTGGDALRRWDLGTGELLAKYGGGACRALTFSTDGRFIATAQQVGKSAWWSELWDAVSGRHLLCLDGGMGVFVVDGSGLLVSGSPGARLYDIRNVLGRLRIEQAGSVHEIAWDRGVLQSAERPDGTWTDVTNATSPHLINTQEGMKFYRLKIE